MKCTKDKKAIHLAKNLEQFLKLCEEGVSTEEMCCTLSTEEIELAPRDISYFVKPWLNSNQGYLDHESTPVKRLLEIYRPGDTFITLKTNAIARKKSTDYGRPRLLNAKSKTCSSGSERYIVHPIIHQRKGRGFYED